MRSIVLSLAAMTASVCVGGSTSTPTGFTDDFDAALKASAASSRPVVAVFSGSDWCCWCTRLEEEVFAKEAFLKDATNRYELVFVDSPRDKTRLSEKAKKRNPELVKKYAIRGYPTVLVLDAQGGVLGKTGYQRGGGEKYLRHLEKLVANGPLVMKHLKPYRDEFVRLTGAFEAESKKLLKDVPRSDKAAVAAAKEKLRVLAPDYRKQAKAIRKRFRAETIPEQITEEKEGLLEEMKSFIRAMRLLAEEKPGDSDEDA